MTNATQSATDKPLTKAQVVKAVAEKHGLTNKQASEVLDTLASLATTELNRVGRFTLPGLLKITRKVRPATAEKQGVNPFTKAPMTIKAKPARNVVKAVALKALKEAVNGTPSA